MNNIQVQSFDGDDRKLLDLSFEIRAEVFVREQSIDLTLEFDGRDPEARHYLAMVNGTPAGTCRWRKTPCGVKLERFAVLPAMRRMGIGKALLKAALFDLKDETYIYLHAQESAVIFYSKIGFSVTGEPFTEAGIIHYKMVLNPAFKTV